MCKLSYPVAVACLFSLFLGGWLLGLGCKRHSSPVSLPSASSASPPSKGEISGTKVSEKDALSDRAAELKSPIERELGLPFYPGSKEAKESGQIASGGYVSVRTTRDPIDMVVRFYKSHLPHLDNEVILTNSVTILAEHHGRKVFLFISREGEQTRILLSVGAKK